MVACFSFISSLSHFNYQRSKHNSIHKKLGNENNGFNHERIHKQINVHEKSKNEETTIVILGVFFFPHF